MKQKILNQIKRLQLKQMMFVTVFAIGLFVIFISLSIQNEALFLKEILLCSAIVGLALISQKQN